MKRALASLLLFLALPASAEVKLGGYLKDFWQYSRSAIDGRPYNLNTFRARLSVDADKGPFKAHVDLDNQVAAGSYFRTREFQLFGYAPPKPWLDMEHTVSTGTTNGYGIGAYRAWIGLENDEGTLRAGRQRIAWGTGKMWNPTDVLNPWDPSSIEQTERRGVDALYGRKGIGTLGQAELVWAPGDRWADHNLLARGRANFEGWDVSALFGKISGSTYAVMAGGDLARELFEGTAHAEAAYFAPVLRNPYWKVGAGYDYNFASDTKWKWLKDANFVFEYYHAGNGAENPARYDLAAARAGKEQGLARDYLGSTLSKDLHTLLKFECAAIVNMHDRSTLAYPSLGWNALPDLWLTAAWRRFGGERTGEFGRQPNQVVLTGQWWF